MVRHTKVAGRQDRRVEDLEVTETRCEPSTGPDILTLLEGRLARGELSEKTYLMLRSKYTLQANGVRPKATLGTPET